jgi:small neutral amino acid transporter SnatA (MarC family)
MYHALQLSSGQARGTEVMKVNKLIGAAFGLAISWVVSEVAEDILKDLGIPKNAAKAAGGIIGAVIA